MSEHQIQRKSRRRFLADMLFLGGSLTAAGLLAKSQLLTPDPEPAIAGKMVAPQPAPGGGTPSPLCSPTPVAPDDLPPGVEGGMTLPQPVLEKADPRHVPRPDHDAMQSRGAVAMPRPTQKKP